ncbi:hypothetical protein NDN08_005989 [Rhodosorus marinus]|uniref:LITAF domain-containing protein n=1 Tax=Rhodosorus marinus TaxID=101924 RepID=A0AAV8UJX7_9RHOD|nr:hypothetical protein NDN08_005989 [Rhodosorus marinus]
MSYNYSTTGRNYNYSTTGKNYNMAGTTPMSTGRVVFVPRDLGKKPRQLTCPKCENLVETETNVETCTGLNWMYMGIACAFFAPCAACCIFSKSCANCSSEVAHSCPKCGDLIGVSYA